MFEDIIYFLNNSNIKSGTQKYKDIQKTLQRLDLSTDDFIVDKEDMEKIKSDTPFEQSRNFFEKTSKGKKLLKTINSTFKGKIKKYKKELQEELYGDNGIIKNIKKELLEGLNNKIEEKLNTEIEGIVIRNEDDDQIKLVDKEGFTQRLKKYWKYIDIISNKIVEDSNSKKYNGIERTFTNKLKLLTIKYIGYKYNDLKREFKEKSLEEFES
jgi:hypothetical protein